MRWHHKFVLLLLLLLMLFRVINGKNVSSCLKSKQSFALVQRYLLHMNKSNSLKTVFSGIFCFEPSQRLHKLTFVQCFLPSLVFKFQGTVFCFEEVLLSPLNPVNFSKN